MTSLTTPWTSDFKMFWTDFAKKEKMKLSEAVGEYQLVHLRGDASTRRYFRIIGLSDSYILCEDQAIKSEIADFIQVQKYLSDNRVRVPAIYHIDYSRGLLLEEDLGEITFLKMLSENKDRYKEFELYSEVVDLLLDLHNLKEKADLSVFNRSFDMDKLFFEVNFTNHHFINKVLNVSDVINVTKKISSYFYKIISILAQRPFYFCHRDFHSKNLLVKDNSFVVIDFQDARLGPVQYDLASLLDDCYYELDISNKQKLLKYYFENSREKKNISFEEFSYIYDLMCLQRGYKAIGSFAYVFNERKNPYYLKYIGFVMEKLKRIMIKYREFDELRVLLLGLYYEN